MTPINKTQKINTESLCWETLGDALEREKKGPDAVIQAYKKALELWVNPPAERFCHLKYKIGCVYEDLKNFPQAKEHFLAAWNRRKSLDSEKCAQLAGALGACYFEMNELKTSILFFTKRIKLTDANDPKKQNAYQRTNHNIAKAQIQLGQYADAIPRLKNVFEYYKITVVSPDKELMQVCNHIALSFERLEQLEDAIKFNSQALTHCPPDHIKGQSFTLYNLALLHLRSEKYSEALQFVGRSRQWASQIEKTIDLEGPLSMLEGHCYSSMGNIAKALGVYQDVARLYKEKQPLYMFPQAMLRAGHCLAKQEKYSEAISCHEQAFANILKHEPEKVDQLRMISARIKNFRELAGHLEALEVYRRRWKWIKMYKDPTPKDVETNLIPMMQCHYRLDHIRQADILWHRVRLYADLLESETLRSELHSSRQKMVSESIQKKMLTESANTLKDPFSALPLREDF